MKRRTKLILTAVAAAAVSIAIGLSIGIPMYVRYLMDNMDTKYALIRALADLVPPARHIVMDRIEDLKVPGPSGGVPVRVYIPKKIVKNAPAVMYMHGGGYVLGSPALKDGTTRTLARDGSCVVVSVGYRLAPEHPYPAGLTDCHAVLEWLAVHAQELGSGSNRVVVAGDSAGANFAAVLSLMARDRGAAMPAGQILFSPPVGAIDPDTGKPFPSRTERAASGILTGRSMEAFGKFYLGDPVRYRNDPYVNPIAARDFGGLPPALVVTCGRDPLSDEGIAYVGKLRGAGVPVRHVHLPDREHAYTGTEATAPAVRFLEEVGTDGE